MKKLAALSCVLVTTFFAAWTYSGSTPTRACSLGPAQKNTILFWTSFFKYDGAAQYLEFKGFENYNCSEDCRYTSDRSLLSEASLVVFHCYNFDRADLPHRYCGQKWVFWCKENPAKYEDKIKREDFELFDITSTYRLDSDVPIPYALYGPQHLRMLTKRAPADDKIGVVAWLASNCHATSTRLEYVAELMKHVEVHSYGDCLRNRPPIPGSYSAETVGRLLGRYKFYLAFENARCTDYVSEKLFRTYELAIVPVVMGPDNMSAFEPVKDRSFVKTSDFKSPAELGRFLTKLSQNDELYDEYLAYKNPDNISPAYKAYWFQPRAHHACGLCNIAVTGRTLQGNAPRGGAWDDSCIVT